MSLPESADSTEVFNPVKEFCDKATPTLGCRLITSRVEVRVDNIGPLAAEKEVADALTAFSGESISEKEVRLTTQHDSTKTARVRVSEKAAEKLAGQHIKVMFTSSPNRVQQPTDWQPRCFRCLALGHVRAKCKSVIDRSNACIRCGKTNHLAMDCQEEPCCTVCKGPHSVGHPTCRR
ncbi:uncharacterized protein LOC118507745 [Anopheles stephensi]|uniref:uncharacterized protein LOC118507745 n=1 Tax=Anopheles stephensi TaxID=30069 RepID=UPI001658AAD2|nr:uncharacterized protein LOC118507745 [Anopheles stephensi]